ncbi:MAG: SMC-Scp complex subunit ScpB, partial [Arenicellales bacterium WSBS_2016_MAG_OTU3]
MSADGALSISRILAMFPKDAQPEKENLENAITGLQQDCEGCGVELRKVGNRYRYYTRDAYAPWLRKLRSTKTPRYSRALLETLSIIAYRQPVSRGDVEDIRGVAVSTDIMRSLVDREWVKQVGYRDVPGRPALYGTTRLFLEYFGLSSLQELPVLMDQRELGDIAKDMNMELPLSMAPVDEQSTGEQVDHDTAQEQAAAEYVRAEKTDDGQSEDHTDIDSEEVPPDTSEQATQIDLSGNESITEEPVKDSSENQSGREST